MTRGRWQTPIEAKRETLAHKLALPARGSAVASSFNHSAWRSALATSVASVALIAYGARPVRAQTVPPAPPCNQISGITGSIVTCSGDLSGGVDLPNAAGPYEVLNVGNLTANIAPAAGVTGILFTSNGAVELNVNTGPFAILANDADGMFAASNSGTVTIHSTADIVTTGNGAVGIRASGQNDLLTITSSGNIATSGDNAFGIAAGAIYGAVTVTSTGNIATAGTFAAGINVGTIGLFGTDDGAITITSMGDVATAGASAIGINAASVYGSIDINSFGNVAAYGVGAVAINAQTSADIHITSLGNIATGPDSSSAISAISQVGNITITSTGDIATAGDDGVGIYARAGATAMVFSYGNIVTLGDSAPGIAAAGYTGTAVVSTGSIRTSGVDSPGITVMSDGDVAVASTGHIKTTGDTSDGINVVSTGGMVAVVNSGDISATGLGSAGIYAAGYAGTLVMNTGNVVGGPCCAGVMQRSAYANMLLNWGTITAGLADFAIDNVGDGNTVENFGTVTGDVRLLDTGGGNQFINHAGALFNAGANVGAGFVTNDGTISPGGRGAILTTVLGDSFVQNASGVFAVDVDAAAGTSDRLSVADSAELAGAVAVGLTTLPITAAQTFTIVSSLNGTTNNGLGLIASPALHATLTFDANDVVLGISVDFRADGLNPNQRAIATNLGEIFAAGVGGVGPVLLGLLNVSDLAEFKNALDQLSPEIYSDAEIAALYSSLAFTGSLLSCKVNGTDTASIIREGQCLWAGASARFLDSGTTNEQIGFNEAAGLFNAGAQVALDDVWRLGVGAGYQTSSLDTATGAQSEGSLAQAGVSVKYNPGPLLLAGVLSGGGAWYDTRRPMSFGGFTGIATGDQDLGIFSGSLRAAYVLGAPSLYFKPILDANITHLELGGFTESGGNGAALSVDGGGQTIFSLAPTLEAGTEWWLGNGTLVRPLIRAGAIWYEGADFAMTAAFAGAPLGVSPFTINTDIDEVMGLVGAGIEMINGGDAALRLSYDGQLGSQTQIHSVGIKGSAKF